MEPVARWPVVDQVLILVYWYIPSVGLVHSVTL
jgi:hypothetical protein